MQRLAIVFGLSLLAIIALELLLIAVKPDPPAVIQKQEHQFPSRDIITSRMYEINPEE